MPNDRWPKKIQFSMFNRLGIRAFFGDRLLGIGHSPNSPIAMFAILGRPGIRGSQRQLAIRVQPQHAEQSFRFFGRQLAFLAVPVRPFLLALLWLWGRLRLVVLVVIILFAALEHLARVTRHLLL